MFSRLKQFFSPRLDDYNNNTKKMISKYGNNRIIEINIYRTPLYSIINKFINTLSLGGWNDLQKKYGFDTFYHLGVVLTLENNKNIIVEKLDVISISDSYKTNSTTQIKKVSNYTPNTENLNTFLSSARSGLNNDKLWFGYDPLTNNCQYFIKYLLEYNNLYDEELNNFIFQDISDLVKDFKSTKSGYITSKIMKFTTDLSATFNKLLGRGIPILFNNLTKSDLYKIIKIYDLSKLIKNYRKLSKKELINNIETFLYIDNNTIHKKDNIILIHTYLLELNKLNIKSKNIKDEKKLKSIYNKILKIEKKLGSI